MRDWKKESVRERDEERKKERKRERERESLANPFRCLGRKYYVILDPMQNNNFFARDSRSTVVLVKILELPDLLSF